MNFSQRGQMFKSAPTPQKLSVLLQFFYRAFLTIPATLFFFSYLYVFWSLQITKTETYVFGLSVSECEPSMFFIRQPSKQFCCNMKVLSVLFNAPEVQMILTETKLGCQH